MARTRLEGFTRRHEQALPLRLERLRERVSQAERLLATLKLSEQAILDRGYALVLDQSGALVRRAADVNIGQALELRFADGPAHVTATDGGSDHRPASRVSAKSPSRPKTPGDQGSLF